MLGRRYPHKINYRVGFDDSGKLLGLDVKFYEGLGCLPDEKSAAMFPGCIDNGLFILVSFIFICFYLFFINE
jgi:xanthine dehydrogenase molybdopterin-binding subunit B